MIIGTAGHVDHGKSTLITALTGRPMDRLAEEKRRGITIELGFTHIDLDGGVRAGIVDVPGHEDFVRTMVAGASGIDVALLVIAADDGIMPQTREHLLVLEQLRVPAGVPVITKADLVEPDWLELVTREVEEWLAASPVRFTTPLAVSVRTGTGIEALKERLGDVARRASLVARDPDDLFRLPVDRSFTVAGAGTVVTGTAWSGTVRVGARVLVLPAGVEARIRSLEVHGEPREQSEPGTRTALALSGVERRELARGQVVVDADQAWAAARSLDVELELARDAAPLRDRSRIRVHLGTAEVMARIQVTGIVSPGARRICRLRLEAPVVARGGDRLVVRSFSPVTVIGGGVVLDPQPVARRAIALPSRESGTYLAQLVARRRWGVTIAQLAVLSGTTPDQVEASLGSSGLARAGTRLLTSEALLQLAARLAEEVEQHHTRSPTDPGVSAETLRRSLGAPDEVADTALRMAVEGGALRVRSGLVARPDFEPRATATEPDLARVLGVLERERLRAPSVAQLAQETGTNTLQVLKALEAKGLVVPLHRDCYVLAVALAEFRATLEALGTDGAITPARLRDWTGLSRKYLIPLLEWADRAGITVREDEGRRLNPRRNVTVRA